MRKFKTDITSAHHHQVLGYFGQRHDGGIVQIRNIAQARQRGNHGATTDIDENAAGLQGSPAHLDRPWPDEYCLPLDHLGVLQVLHPLVDAVARLQDDLVLAGLDALHLDRDVACGKSEFGTAPGHVNRPRTGHHGFGRYAAHIDTGAAKVPALDHRRAQALRGAARSQRRPCLAGSDDDGIKRFDLHALLQFLLAQEGLRR